MKQIWSRWWTSVKESWFEKIERLATSKDLRNAKTDKDWDDVTQAERAAVARNRMYYKVASKHEMGRHWTDGSSVHKEIKDWTKSQGALFQK